MDHRTAGLFRRSQSLQRRQARSHSNGLARRISRPSKLIPPRSVLSDHIFVHRLTSAAEVREKPKQNGEHDADDQTRHDWKVERRVLAAMNDIAGQAAKAKRQTRSEIKRGSNGNANRANNQEGPSEFAERVHSASLKACEF